MNLSSLEKKVSEQVVRMKEEMVQTVQALVRIPSLVGRETTAQAYMDRLYRSLNLEVTSFLPAALCSPA